MDKDLNLYFYEILKDEDNRVYEIRLLSEDQRKIRRKDWEDLFKIDAQREYYRSEEDELWSSPDDSDDDFFDEDERGRLRNDL